MSRKQLLIMLFFITCSIQAMAQTYYYYYKGNKIPLTLNENKVVVSIPKDCGDVIERFHANVQTWNKIKSESFDSNIILRSEYEKLTSQDFWAEDSKSVILTSSYFTENGDEVFATPSLNVRLKKEEDIDLLTSYAERYKLTIVKNMPTMPLWYILHVTPESEKSPMECANEIYESGDFADSIADFTFDALDDTTIRNITTDALEESSVFYDLQGHRLTGKPTKGLYIRKGRKIIAK